MTYNNYYYYKDGTVLESGRYFSEADVLMVANLVFVNDNIDHIYTVSRQTGEIVNILQK